MPLSAIRLVHFVAGGLAVLLLGSGCSTSVSSVNGTVTYEGQPIQQGEITFTPADGVGPVVGSPISAGTFTVSSIAPGKKVVQISDLPTLEFAKSTEELAKAAQQGARPAAPPPNLMPANAAGNGATIEIKAGNQTLNFDLKKPAAK